MTPQRLIFADYHNHALPGMHDGPRTPEDAERLVGAMIQIKHGTSYETAVVTGFNTDESAIYLESALAGAVSDGDIIFPGEAIFE